MAKRQVKPWVKWAAILLGVGVIGYGLSVLAGGTDTTDVSKKSVAKVFSGLKSNTIRIGTNSYVGFMPLSYLKHNKDVSEQFNTNIEITIQDDFEAGRMAYLNGDIDMLYVTGDCWPVETGSQSNMVNSSHVLMLNWSRGSDVMVVNSTIKTVADLKGKTVAVAMGTASNTLLNSVLEANGMSLSDVKLVKVASGGDAAQIFKTLRCDAAVVWSPDDADCLEGVRGSKVLFSTKDISNIVSDGLIVKKDYLEKNYDKVKNAVEAILFANSEMTNNPIALENAIKVFAKDYSFDESFVKATHKNVRFATLGDNENFYGLRNHYVGMTGEQIYTKMARVYEDCGLTKKPLPWRKVSDTRVIEDLVKHNMLTNNQTSEKEVVFTAPTNKDVVKKELSDKKASIEFATNSYMLSEEARITIQREFVSLTKEFASLRIRVEGNCDNTGDASTNKKLSALRAQSVVDYLVREYGFDKNRFIVIGNGAELAIKDGSVGSNSRYRFTSFQMLPN